MPLNKLYNLKVNPGAKSSRFVVDLKQDLAQAGNVSEARKQAKQNVETRLEVKLEKLAGVDYGRMLKQGKERSGRLINDVGKNIKSFWIAGQARNDKKINGKNKKKTVKRSGDGAWDFLAEELTFFGISKILYIILKKVILLFYKICYRVGWLIMFILRLAFLILLAIARPITGLINYLFFKLQTAIAGTLKVLPAGFKATQVVAISLFVRLLRFFQKLAMTKIQPPLPPLSGGGTTPLAPLVRGVAIFAGVLLIIILPVKAFTYYKAIDIVKGKVLGASENAMADLMSAGQAAVNLDFSQADQGFTGASDNFLKAQNELKEINGLILALASVAPDENLRLAAASRQILKSGELSALAGKNLSLAMESIFGNPADDINNILKNLTFYGHNAIANLNDLNQTLEKINSESIPEMYQKNFILLKQKSGELNRGLKEFIGLADSLSNFLGASAAKRYLLVFQNNAELRASGGFIGSFALIDFSKGAIKNIEVPGGGSYDTEAGLLKKIKAPEPLSLVRPDWRFWDANWWPDWPMSARKLAWFYENSDGATVDGVIGLTPTVIEKLLTIIGPVDLNDKYGSTTLGSTELTEVTTSGLIITADNFWLETQKLAEQKPEVTREPKKIIGDLMNKIIAELPKRLSQNNLIPLFKAIEESLTDKNILFYFTDKELEAKMIDLGWGGQIKQTNGDYLNVVNTNIAGGKSDRKIKQQIIHQAEIMPDGSIIDNLTIERTHQAVKREPFAGVRNVNWLRIYVPLGAELLEATGFKPVDKIFFEKEIAGLEADPDVLAGESQARTDELSGTKIYNELNKTVFANWSQLDPGETTLINLKYRLPFKLTDKKPDTDQALTDRLIAAAGAFLNREQKNLYSYSLLAQKQPGMNSSDILSELKLSRNFQPIWRYPANLAAGQNGWRIAENFNQDKIMAVVVEEE